MASGATTETAVLQSMAPNTSAAFNPPNPNEVLSAQTTLSRGPGALLATETVGGSDAGASGKSLVLHAKADDYRSQPAGDAGGRIACAVIRK